MDLLDTFFNVPILIRTFPMLMSGLWITIQIGATSIIAGLVLGHERLQLSAVVFMELAQEAGQF